MSAGHVLLCGTTMRTKEKATRMNSGASPAGSAQLVLVGDDLRGGDYVHRPDHRHPRHSRPAEGPLAVRDGAQWIVNGYLVALAALFMPCGKPADVLGQRRNLVVGVAAFAVATVLLARGRVEETEPVATATSAA